MKSMREILFVAVVAGCVGCGAGTAADTKAKDEADIRALEDRFVTAFKARDVNAIMTLYVNDPNLVVFDAVPPRQYTGWEAYKTDFNNFFGMFPGQSDVTMTDLEIETGGDIAYSHSIQHTTMTDKAGKKMELTVRVTDGYKKVNGQWLISHEHVSVPADMETMKAVLDSK